MIASGGRLRVEQIMGTAIEGAMNVELTVDLVKKRETPWPRIENAEWIMSVGAGRPLEDAARHGRVADGTEQDRVVLLQLVERLVAPPWIRTITGNGFANTGFGLPVVNFTRGTTVLAQARAARAGRRNSSSSVGAERGKRAFDGQPRVPLPPGKVPAPDMVESGPWSRSLSATDCLLPLLLRMRSWPPGRRNPNSCASVLVRRSYVKGVLSGCASPHRRCRRGDTGDVPSVTSGGLRPGGASSRTCRRSA